MTTFAKIGRASALFGALAAIVAMIGTGGLRAAVTAQELISAGMPPGMADYAARVSRAEGSWGSVNQHGCVGAFQFCPGTFEAYYDGTPQQFINDPSAQVTAWVNYQRNEWNAASRLGMTDLIGQEICYNGRCATVTQSSILMACQFGCQSLDGKLGYVFRTGDCEGRGARDGNLKSVCDYLIDGAGYDVSDITNMTEEFTNPNGEPGGGGSPLPPMPLMPWNDRA